MLSSTLLLIGSFSEKFLFYAFEWIQFSCIQWICAVYGIDSVKAEWVHPQISINNLFRTQSAPNVVRMHSVWNQRPPGVRTYGVCVKNAKYCTFMNTHTHTHYHIHSMLTCDLEHLFSVCAISIIDRVSFCCSKLSSLRFCPQIYASVWYSKCIVKSNLHIWPRKKFAIFY